MAAMTTELKGNLPNNTVALTTEQVTLLELLTNNDPQATVANFSNSQVNDHRLQQLCASLSKNTFCTQLNLSKNNFGLEGLLAIATLIGCNTTLTKVDLSFNTLHVRGALALSRVVPSSNIISMNLQNCGSSTGAILMAMMSKPSTSRSNPIQSSLQPGSAGIQPLPSAAASIGTQKKN
jgi:hypothetical protein